jgi:acyl dehydratase
MADPIHVRLRRSPAGWRSYPGVMLRSRPVVTEVESPRTITVSVEGLRPRRQAALAYARICGFDSANALPITFPHVLAMPLHLRIFAMPEFALRPMGLIHLTNSIESMGELRPELPLDIDVSAQNYRRTDAGLAFDMTTGIRSEGRALWRETCCFLSRWPDPAERPARRPPRPPKAPKDATVLAELPVSLRTAWNYARVSSDFNPIHLNDRSARFFGLRGAIAHGMWSLARSLAVQPHGNSVDPIRIDTQFLTPVQLPARVAIKQWTEDGQVRRALCDVRTGRVHMYAWWTQV